MKQYKVTVNGETYLVELEEVKPGEQPQAAAPAPAKPAAESAPAAAPVADGVTIEAPLQGTILRIEKPQGAQVKRGETLLILEAMKLENEIIAPQDGEVVQVLVNVGDTAEQGQTLVVLR